MAFTKELDKHIEVTKTTIKDYSNELNNKFMENHSYPEFLKEFLLEYGGLEIPCYSKEHLEQIVVYRILISANFKHSSAEIPLAYSEVLNMPLYRIGRLIPENDEIVVDENGYVYLLGDTAYCCGKNIFEGLEAIFRIKVSDTLELDPTNDNDVVWLEYKNGENRPVDLETYEFNYDF